MMANLEEKVGGTQYSDEDMDTTESLSGQTGVQAGMDATGTSISAPQQTGNVNIIFEGPPPKGNVEPDDATATSASHVRTGSDPEASPAPDRVHTETPQAGVHTSCTQKPSTSQDAVLEQMVQEIDYSVNLHKQQLIDEQEQRSSASPGADIQEPQIPVNADENKQTTTNQTPLVDAAVVVSDSDTMIKSEGLVDSPLVPGADIATNQDPLATHSTHGDIEDITKRDDREPFTMLGGDGDIGYITKHDDREPVSTLGGDGDNEDFTKQTGRDHIQVPIMSISDMPHIVSGQQGVVTPGQPPSETEEPLQLQLKVAHAEIERLKTDVECLTNERDNRQSVEFQRLAGIVDSKDSAWKKTCDTLRAELQQMQQMRDKKELQCASLEKDMKDMKNQIAASAQRETYYLALQNKNIEIMQELANAKGELESLRPTCQSYYQQGVELQRGYEMVQQVCDKLNHEKTELQKTNQHLIDDLQDKQEQISAMGKENSSLVLRLSKIAGAKLTAGNPNITDLSDLHRPTKLAEDFSELYDNEWTDAFEEVTFEADEEKVKFLFKLLKRAYELCMSESSDLFKHVMLQHSDSIMSGADHVEFTMLEDQGTDVSEKPPTQQPVPSDKKTDDMDIVKPKSPETEVDRGATSEDQADHVDPEVDNSAVTDDADMSAHEGTDVDLHRSLSNESSTSLETDVDTGIAVADNQQDGSPREKVQIKVSFEARKVLTDLYKDIIFSSARIINKKLERVIEREFNLNFTEQTYIRDFVVRCVEICWLMVLQMPVVHIHFGAGTEEKFEREKYKAFTAMGKKISYIVWPCVYLHEGGPLLTKGVAQGQN